MTANEKRWEHLGALVSDIRDIFESMVSASQTLQVGQSSTLRSNPKDAAGKPVAPFSGPTYTVDRPDLVALTPSADNLSCVCKNLVASGGIGGTATVTIHGLAVSGGPDITAQVSVICQGGSVTGGVLDHFDPTFDPPVAS